MRLTHSIFVWLAWQKAAEEAAQLEADAAAAENKTKTTRTFKVANIVSNLNPMAVLLQPIQKILSEICLQVRVANNLLSWKDPFVSFWAMAALFVLWIVGEREKGEYEPQQQLILTYSSATIFPYAFFFFWFSRTFFFLLFGPQNYLFFKYLSGKGKNLVESVDVLADYIRLRTKGRERENEDPSVASETFCNCCKKDFDLVYRRTHCRQCARAVCRWCAKNKMDIEVIAYGDDKGATNQRAKVCDACFRGERRQSAVDQGALREFAKTMERGQSANLLLKGLGKVGTLGKGVFRDTAGLGLDVGKGLVGVGGGIVGGVVDVGQKIGENVVDVGKGIGSAVNHAIMGDYVLEVPVERSWKRRYVDKPDITKSKAVKC